MDFSTWTQSLHDRGIRVIPPSHPTPVQLWARLADGRVVLFRCRGTKVMLARYDPADLQMLSPVSGCGCACDGAVAVSAPEQARRVAVGADVRPVEVAVFDGAAERGWSAYEAGLLQVVDAARLFDSLLVQLDPPRPRVYGRQRIRSAGRLGSLLSTTACAASTGRSLVR